MASRPAVHSPPTTDLGDTTLPSSTECRPSQKLLARFWDGVVAIIIALVAQLLIVGIQCALGGESVDFPASILAMAAVFVVFSVSECVLPGVEDFYRKRLKRAVSVHLLLPGNSSTDRCRRNS